MRIHEGSVPPPFWSEKLICVLKASSLLLKIKKTVCKF